jgi:hypothetical protein
MSKRTLDRDRYHGLVYGDPEAKFYQDGLFFKGNGEAIAGQEADVPQAAVDAAAARAQQLVDAPKPQTVGAVDPDEAKKKAKKALAKRKKALEELHVSKLKKAAIALNEQTGIELPAMKGAGLKKRLVKYIAVNTD